VFLAGKTWLAGLLRVALGSADTAEQVPPRRSRTKPAQFDQATVDRRVEHILRVLSREDVADRIARRPRRATSLAQLHELRPLTRPPPQLDDLAQCFDAGRVIEDMLSALGEEHVTGRNPVGRRRAAAAHGQIVRLNSRPAAPPQLDDLASRRAVEHVLGALGVEYVTGRITRRDWRRISWGRQVTPVRRFAAAPPQLDDPPIGRPIEHMLGSLGLEHVTGQLARRRHRRSSAAADREVIEIPSHVLYLLHQLSRSQTPR
jgi:hypothetical protein